MSAHARACDVAVIGYGPVGVTATNLLGRLGLRVLVVERDADVYGRARAISTDEEALRIWQRAGLADALSADMLAGCPLEFVDAAGRAFLSFTPQTFGNGHPPQQFIYQPALERTLRDGVSRYPGVEVLLAHECTALAQDSGGVDLAVRDLTGGREIIVRAAYVIAADGGSSPTRHRLGVGFEGRTYEDRWVVIDTKVRQEWPQAGRLRFHCDPARPAVDCPTPLGHHRWEFPVLPGDDADALITPDGVLGLLARQGIGPHQVEVLRAAIYSHHVRFADRWRAGRVFLARDAAHVMPPWIGQGMASGVRDVDNLCWKLAAALDPALTAQDVGRLLDSYERERMPHVRALTKAAVFFGRVITERRPAVTTLRDPLFRALCSLPGAGSFLRDARWFPVTAYHDGLLAPDGDRAWRTPARPVRGRQVPGPGAGRRRSWRQRPGRRGAVGAHAPQPWVLDERGQRVRLDDALGHIAWAVLHIGPAAGRPDLGRWREAGARVRELLPAGLTPGPGALVDIENALLDWAAARRVTTLALRPDGIVYTAAPAGRSLAFPPIPSLAGVNRCVIVR